MHLHFTPKTLFSNHTDSVRFTRNDLSSYQAVRTLIRM